MPPEPGAVSIQDLFGFYVGSDGQITFTLDYKGTTFVLRMDHDVAESAGLNFLNVAAKAKGVADGRIAVTPEGFVAVEKPEAPPPWGPRRERKTPAKPN